MTLRHLALCSALVLLAACGPDDAPAPQAPPADAAHTSRSSLDWAGVYEGVLPCADCPGVRTRLVLRSDETYELSSQAIGRDEAARVVQGRFAWQASGNAITLEAGQGGQQVLVGEGRVALLEPGAAATWADAEPRALQRVAESAAAPAAAANDVQRTLESHRWTLAGATDAAGQPITALSSGGARSVALGFSEGRLALEGGCNRGTGSYRIDAAGRLVAGRIASTMMACAPEAMAVDTALAELLAEPMAIELSPGESPTLRLVAAGGAALSLAGQMTPEARYGAATRIFLEVAAETVRCDAPPAGATGCLQVRELQFDEQGLRVGEPGAWQPLAEPIEGYTHQPGVRNVLRLKRFERGAAAGAPDFLYVLDLVVESETAPR